MTSKVGPDSETDKGGGRVFLPRKLPGPRSEGGYNQFQELTKVLHSWFVEPRGGVEGGEKSLR